jgi:prepilin-type N-terminal cleavage/methylation domain-containing protein
MSHHRSVRRGLTLVELLIVLMILVALASIIIPMLPSMLTRAHVAAHTTNVTETAKLIAEYQAINNSYPDNWDALTDGTNLVTYLPGGALDPQTPPPGGQAAGQLTAGQPTANEVNALQSAGIGKVHLMVPTPATAPWDGNPFDPTFDYYSAAPSAAGGTAITTGTTLAFLDPQNNPAAMTLLTTNYPGWSTTARYVVLGLGPRSDLIGKMAVTSPVHFGDTPSIFPENGYGRYCGIFKVSDTTVNITNAVLVGVAPIHDVGLIGLDGEFQNWYQLNKGGS